jgi:hypothetical protein
MMLGTEKQAHVTGREQARPKKSETGAELLTDLVFSQRFS